MEKYLGNKRSLLDAIFAYISNQCPNASSICDIFAGTTNVGRYFRKRGFHVLSNDANRFSFIFGAAYLSLNEYPSFSNVPLPKKADHTPIRETLRSCFFSSVKRDRDQLFPENQAEPLWQQLTPLASVLCHLNQLKPKRRNGNIVERFTIFGAHSSFRSVRGTIGKRNYFSLENAQRLDVILETVRSWWQDGCLTEPELYLIMTSILEEVVIVANVNGTFHDFNRTRLWPNALQELILRVPLVHANSPHGRVYCQDALNLAPTLPRHDILYIDPPYNFRQYSAYYHFLNFIAAFPFLDSVDDYLGSLEHVRGQNMKDDFTSEFCFRGRFLAALGNLIEQSPCKYVVMSYYGGRNHWNHWNQNTRAEDHGLLILKEFFERSDLFQDGHTLPVLQLRQNYQSRIGEKKQMVNEHLFFAKKRKLQHASAHQGAPILLHTNEHFGLTRFHSLACTDAFDECRCQTDGTHRAKVVPKNVISEGNWVDLASPGFDAPPCQYRIKEPQWLPLGPDDVPPGSVFRNQTWLDGSYRAPIQVSPAGVYFFMNEGPTEWAVIEKHWQINRPRHRDADGNPTLWEECRKPAP